MDSLPYRNASTPVNLARAERMDVHYVPTPSNPLPWCGHWPILFATDQPDEITCVECMAEIVAREG